MSDISQFSQFSGEIINNNDEILADYDVKSNKNEEDLFNKTKKETN